MKHTRLLLVMLLAVAWAGAQAGVRGQVRIQHLKRGAGGNGGVVVWLTRDGPAPALLPSTPAPHFRMAQRGKQFAPQLLVIPMGAVVDFPNFDPYFHNVFSLGDNHPFDLGLYQAGASRSHRFLHAGVSYVFCNIHPQMTAVIVSVPTRWYAVSNRAGSFVLPEVPPGAYHLHVWYEEAQTAELARVSKPVAVPGSGSLALPLFTLDEIPTPSTHKNKYGQDYDTHQGYGSGGGGSSPEKLRQPQAGG